MADPTLRLTFDDLRIRVAEYLGIAYLGPDGTEQAQIPVDTHDLDLVSRLVNDGYRRFLLDNDKGWKFLTVPLTITFGTGTIDGDAARYYLPDDFYGILVSPFTYAANGPRIRIEPVSEPEIREFKAAGNITGYPSVFTVRAINTTASSDGQRWEVEFFPTPTGTETVTALYKRFPSALSSSTDVSVAGFQHDQTVLAAALAAAELHRNDGIGIHEDNYQRLLDQSRRLDARAGVSRGRYFGDNSDNVVAGRTGKFTDVFHNGEEV